jgi:CDP-diacylglycerol--glycerol-3-phosphate 3-phosphatidyltransferase
MGLSWPNRITILRILLSPIFMVLLMTSSRGSRIAALVVFVVAALTDIYDGYLARKYGWITNLGKFLDPLADKLLVALALIGLVQIEIMPVWGAYLIIGRELLVTGLRAIAAYAGVLILPSRLGKWKTVAQMISLLCYLFLSVVGLSERSPFISTLETTALFTLVLAVGLTLVSGADYFWRNRSILKRLLQ